MSKFWKALANGAAKVLIYAAGHPDIARSVLQSTIAVLD